MSFLKQTILFHSSHGQIFSIDITPQMTVGEVKNILCSQAPEYQPDESDIIFNNNPLQDNQQIAGISPELKQRVFILNKKNVNLKTYNFKGFNFHLYSLQLDPTTITKDVKKYFKESHPELIPESVVFKYGQKSTECDDEKEIDSFNDDKIKVVAKKKPAQPSKPASGPAAPPKSASGPAAPPPKAASGPAAPPPKAAPGPAAPPPKAAPGPAAPPPKAAPGPAAPPPKAAPGPAAPPPKAAPGPAAPPPKADPEPAAPPPKTASDPVVPPQNTPAPLPPSSIPEFVPPSIPEVLTPAPQPDPEPSLPLNTSPTPEVTPTSNPSLPLTNQNPVEYPQPSSNNQSTIEASQPQTTLDSSSQQNEPSEPENSHPTEPSPEPDDDDVVLEVEPQNRVPIDAPTPLPDHNFKGFTPSMRQIEAIRAYLTDSPETINEFYEWLKRTNPKDAQILQKNQNNINRLLRINEVPKNKSPSVGLVKFVDQSSQGPKEARIVPPNVYEEKFRFFIEYLKDDKNAQKSFTNLHKKYNTVDPANLFGVFISCDKNENEVVKNLS